MKIHIVSHTHWDREWYRPFQYFKVRLSYFFDKLFSTLEENDDYAHFMLDGQMVMIEDYLNLEPQNKEKIKRLVGQGRLIVGPWYSQPDEFAPSGESLVRNLLIGINTANEYGYCMKVGYLPDSFGQSCQMPQILNGCNIKSACVMRGVPMHKIDGTEFIWRGLNGDEVLTVALPKGYSNGMFLPKDNITIDMRVGTIIKGLKEYGNDENILVLNGVDHQFPQPQVVEYIKSKREKDVECVHSTLEQYIEDAGQNQSKIKRLDGELISPVTNRVHTSIASSRMYQKTKNRHVETLLCNRVEPLCTMSYLLGAKYPQSVINSAFKELIKNQAHDSICGCCTDEVHREIDQRFTDIENMGTTLNKMHSRAISSIVSGDDLVLTVFNDSMTKGRQIVNAVVYTDSDIFALVNEQGEKVNYTIEKRERIDAASLSIWSLYLDTPCMVNKFSVSFEIDFEFNYGYKRLVIAEGQEPAKDTGINEIEAQTLENQFSIITLNHDGTFNLLDKQSGKEYYNLNTIEDCGDAGDTYNFSPVENDRVVSNSSINECKITVKNSINKSTALLCYEMHIPQSLSANEKSRSDELIPLKIESEITLYNDIKRIDIKTKVENRAKDHRIRAVFPTAIKSDYSYAQTQFGTIKRNNTIEDVHLWEDNKWAEKPLPIYSNHKFVYVNDSDTGLAVLNRGLTEYEIYEQDGSAIAVTLFRGVGYMGKPDLAVRPGRPSGVNVKTPDAQCLGEHVLHYSILAFDGENDCRNVAKQAEIFNAMPTAAQSEIKLKEIKRKFSDMIMLFDFERLQHCVENDLENIERADYKFVDITENRLIISALKKAENDEAIILRVYNCTGEIINSAKIYINATINKVYECDFLENNITELSYENQVFETNMIKGYTAKTYRIIPM